MRGLCSKQDYTGDVVPTKAAAGTQLRGNRWAPLEDGSLDGWGGGQRHGLGPSECHTWHPKGQPGTEKPLCGTRTLCCWGSSHLWKSQFSKQPGANFTKIQDVRHSVTF